MIRYDSKWVVKHSTGWDRARLREDVVIWLIENCKYAWNFKFIPGAPILKYYMIFDNDDDYILFNLRWA
jgi:hypothetical protein